MTLPETMLVYVRNIPVAVFEQIRAKAFSEGVKPNDGAVALWALTQFAKSLNTDKDVPK